ncbi:UNVERIFIED_CONTAM: hypothetical protein GTU68_002055 [Idotea baltica]|nr:hypothetical protein [Idotea baltica]
MPKISIKGANMPSSPIRKLVPFADKAKQAGKEVLHLNIGQPDIKTPSKMLNAIRNFDQEILAYIHSEGTPPYREKLAKYYHSIGAKNITANHLIETTGGSEALIFTLFSILDEGDEIIVPEPFYANYNGFSQAGSIKIVPVTATLENNFALPPMEDFEKLVTNKTKAILICNPSNPTGYLYSKEELETLKQIVLKHDLFLIADEVYREFVYDGREHFSILNLEDVDNNTIVIDSTSKRYSACGLRLGTIVTRNVEVRQTAIKFAQARLSPPTLGEVAASAALDVPTSYFEEVKEEYEKRRTVLINGLKEIDGIKCPAVGGAFYALVELPVKDASHFCQWMLESFDYKGTTIMLAPGDGFYFTKGLGKNQVRIAYVLNADLLKLALTILAEGLKKYLSIHN